MIIFLDSSEKWVVVNMNTLSPKIRIFMPEAEYQCEGVDDGLTGRDSGEEFRSTSLVKKNTISHNLHQKNDQAKLMKGTLSTGSLPCKLGPAHTTCRFQLRAKVLFLL